jgi:hypothetical protein
MQCSSACNKRRRRAVQTDYALDRALSTEPDKKREKTLNAIEGALAERAEQEFSKLGSEV